MSSGYCDPPSNLDAIALAALADTARTVAPELPAQAKPGVWRIYHFKNPTWAGDVEPACLALTIAGVPFDEVRLDPMEDWPTLKASGACQYDQLPVLVMDFASPSSASSAAKPQSTMCCGSGSMPAEPDASLQVVAQSNSIIRACAMHAGLMDVEDALRFAKVDEVLCAVQDIRSRFFPSMLQQSPEKKVEMRKALVKNVLLPWLHKFEAMLQTNIAQFGQGFCVGPRLSIADIAVDCLMAWLESDALTGVQADELGLDRFPCIVAARRNVQDLPQVQSRRASGPRHRPEEVWYGRQKLVREFLCAAPETTESQRAAIVKAFAVRDPNATGLISKDEILTVFMQLGVFDGACSVEPALDMYTKDGLVDYKALIGWIMRTQPE